MSKKNDSIFKILYDKEEFIDRKALTNEEAIDIIIPIFNTNELFEKNLYSFYKEIPINRLIIGDGGSTDDSIEILNKFPRVKIVDQQNYRSLGFCLAELISLVETTWFVYLHADVYLPENWYDTMKKNQNKYDWFECNRRVLIMIDHKENIDFAKRSYSGSQMGKKEAFKNIFPKIEDGYLYRNEDLVFQGLIEAEGFKYGRVLDTFHYHQLLNKKGEKEPKFTDVVVLRDRDAQWEIKTYIMQVKGIIKYLNPNPFLINAVNEALTVLKENNALDNEKFKSWVKKTKVEWLMHLNIDISLRLKIMKKILNLIRPFYMKLFR